MAWFSSSRDTPTTNCLFQVVRLLRLSSIWTSLSKWISSFSTSRFTNKCKFLKPACQWLQEDHCQMSTHLLTTKRCMRLMLLVKAEVHLILLKLCPQKTHTSSNSNRYFGSSNKSLASSTKWRSIIKITAFWCSNSKISYPLLVAPVRSHS